MNTDMQLNNDSNRFRKYYVARKNKVVENTIIKYHLEAIEEYLSIGTSDGIQCLKINIPLDSIDRFLNDLSKLKLQN